MSGLGPGCPARWPGCLARRLQIGIWTSKLDLGRKLMISGAKLGRFRGWKVGKLGEMLYPIETKRNHGSNPTKLRQTNKSQKPIGAIFGRIFEIGEEHNKIRLENKRRGSEIVINVALDTKMM